MSDKSTVEVRLMATQSGDYVVIVKGMSGTVIVLTPTEAVDVAQQLLNVAQAIAQAKLDSE